MSAKQRASAAGTLERERRLVAAADAMVRRALAADRVEPPDLSRHHAAARNGAHARRAPTFRVASPPPVSEQASRASAPVENDGTPALAKVAPPHAPPPAPPPASPLGLALVRRDGAIEVAAARGGDVGRQRGGRRPFRPAVGAAHRLARASLFPTLSARRGRDAA